MESIDADQKYVKAAIEQIQLYLSSQNVFWPMGSMPFPLTIGNLLFSLRRLSVSGSSEQLAAEVTSQLEETRKANRALFQQKEKVELKARLREWTANQEEWSEAGLTASVLATEVRNRTIITLLINDLDQDSVTDSLQLDSTDQNFKSITELGNFIWDEELARVFPADEFWFLWRKPGGRKA